MSERQRLTLQELLEAGISARFWEKHGKRRIYLNDLPALYGLTCSYYGTGNVSSAKLDGEHISNSKARTLLADLDSMTVWWDCGARCWQGRATGLYRPDENHYRAAIVREAENRLAAVESKPATPE
jgi:hypothetical protein